MRAPKHHIRVAVTDPAAPHILALASELGIPAVQAFGHFVRLVCMAAPHLHSGLVAELADERIAGWAAWQGSPVAFAEAFRQHACTPDGIVIGWASMFQPMKLDAYKRGLMQVSRSRNGGRPSTEGAEHVVPQSPVSDTTIGDCDTTSTPLNVVSESPNVVPHTGVSGTTKRAPVNKRVVTSTEKIKDNSIAGAQPKRSHKKKLPAVRADGTERTQEWIAPYWDAWKATYDGEMPVGKNAHILAKLEDQHGVDEVVRRWKIMLARNKPQFATAQLLQSGWGTFALEASDGGKPLIEQRAAKLYTLLIKRGVCSMPGYEALVDRLVDLQREGLIKSVESFLELLRKLDLDLIRNARVPAFAIQHITERIGDQLSA